MGIGLELLGLDRLGSLRDLTRVLFGIENPRVGVRAYE